MLIDCDIDIPKVIEQFGDQYFKICNVPIPYFIEQIGDNHYAISEDGKEAYLISDSDPTVRIVNRNYDVLIDITAENSTEARKIAEALVKLLNMNCLEVK